MVEPEPESAATLYKVLRTLFVCLGGYCFLQFLGWLSKQRKFNQALAKLPGPSLESGPRSGFWTAHLRPFLDAVGTIPGYPHVTRGHEIQQGLYEEFREKGLFRLFLFHPYRVPFVARGLIFVFDIEFVRQLLTDPQTRTKIVKEPSIFSLAEAVVGGSFLTLDNTPRWKHQRKLTAWGMNQKLLEQVHDTVVGLLHEKVFPKLDRKSNSATEEVVVWSTRLASEVLGLIAFSRPLGGLDDDKSIAGESLFDIYQVLLGIIAKRTRIPSFIRPFLFKENREFQRCSNKLNDFVQSIVQERMAEGKTNKDNKGGQAYQDLLSYMIEDTDADLKPTEQEIFANARMFLFAGQDTTSSTLSWTLYELARNPTIQGRLQTELDEMFERCSSPSYKDIASLQYLDAIVKESLRLHAPAGVARQAIDEITLQKDNNKKEYIVPKGTILYFFPFMTGQEGGLGLEFFPERFLKANKTKNTNNDLEQQWVPFSIGSRDCVGKPMAIAELKVILAYVLHRYTLRKSDTCDEEPINVVTLAIKPHKIMLDFEKRKKNQ